jgi:DsbC/DsbD-like thiol-disulfide interchange protein
MRQGTGNREQGLGWCVLAAVVAVGCVVMRAQDIQFGEKRAPAGRGHVSYAPEVAEVEAGKASVVELRFRVDEGFHVNSHTPASEMLIPTALKLEPAAGVKVLGEEYPKGMAFRLGAETLDVYQGEFRVRLRVVAPKGSSTITGGLRYQACDSAACFPPRTVAVSVVVTGK